MREARRVCPGVHPTEVNEESPVYIYFLKAKTPSSFYETLRNCDCLFSHSACERCQKVFKNLTKYYILPNEEEDMDMDMSELI